MWVSSSSSFWMRMEQNQRVSPFKLDPGNQRNKTEQVREEGRNQNLSRNRHTVNGKKKAHHLLDATQLSTS